MFAAHTLLTALLLTAPPPAGDLPKDSPATPDTPQRLASEHTDAAHSTLRMDVRAKLVPNLRSYEALSKDVLDNLGFLTTVKSTAEYLDGIRNSVVTRSLENTIPGFIWLTRAYDSLRKLATRGETVKLRIAALKQMSSDLLKAAERYTDTPTNAHFQTLMRGFDDARVVFRDARSAFDDLDELGAAVDKALAKADKVVGALRKLPWLGSQYDSLADDIDSITAKLTILRQVMKITRTATERDEKVLSRLRTTLDEAHAHDAYEQAARFATRAKPGSAMTAFREVRHKWPDTQWAHLSDRKIVELTAHIDQIQADLTQARHDLAVARQALSRKPNVVAQPVEQTRVVTTIAPANPLMWGVAGALGVLLLLGLAAAWLRRQT